MARKKATGWIVALAAAFGMAAYSEVTVTVSLSGSVEEMLPILQHLKDMGFTTTPEQIPLKVEVQSQVSGEDVIVVTPAEKAPEPEPIPEAPKPLGFGAAHLAPSSVRAGGEFTLTVEVNDPEHRVDTIEVSIPTLGFRGDLYDNGAGADKSAGDGLWTAAITAPRTARAGTYTITATAYDANADPLMIADSTGQAKPMSVSAEITVTE